MAGRFRVESVTVVVLIVCLLLAGCSGERPETTVSDSGDGNSDMSNTATEATETTGAEIGGDAALEDGSSRSALVTRVIDGDTVEVSYRGGGTDTVRLLGVDTPEVSGDVSPEEFEGVANTEAGREHLREWARRASSFAREELSGSEVEIVTDSQADRRDRYGRLLAYVVPNGDTAGNGGETAVNNGESFNAALLGEGYARLYESSFDERDRYERIEARARERGVGLWGFDDGSESSQRDCGVRSGVTVDRS